MASRHRFRAWGDQRPDPDIEHGFHSHGDPYDPHVEPPRSPRSREDREIEEERRPRSETRAWHGAGMQPEFVAFPWAGPLSPKPRRRPGRPIWDRAADEMASWFGDDEATRRREEDYSGVGPRAYRRSDVRIEEDVNDVLTDHPALDASDIEVTVGEQEVTLDGHVRSRGAKRLAEDCADAVSGVQHVQNNLRIRGSASESEAFAPGSST